MSFIYFHGYMPKLLKAQIDAGLVKEKHSGLRFCQSIDIGENMMFNRLAAVGSEFYNYVNETRCPIYIDRLQGGCFFHDYKYDMDLVKIYRDMLGNDFYGFQMHEWMSNYLGDSSTLINKNCPEPWTEEGIVATLKREFPYEHVFTQAMSAKEMAQVGRINDLNSYITAMKNLFEKRQNYTGGLLPCDSYVLAYPLEFMYGAERVMPEIGQQTRNTSVQIAYARGTSKAYKKSFGTYYEPWGGKPFSACNYQRDGKNEWNIDNDSFPFKTAGGNGGSSRSLQKRMHIYSYVSGAQFMSEEWGLCNVFYDWNDFELTPYGKVKLDFVNFVEKYPDIGETITPVAVVIPKEIIALDVIDKTNGEYFDFYAGETLKNRLDNMRKWLRIYFNGSSEIYGNENGCLVNRIFPDAIDIVNEDVYDDKKYAYAVNLTGNEDFSKKHKCCAKEDVENILKETLPCVVTGGLHHIINKNSKGEYYLTILNNTGIIRSVADGEYGLKEAEKTVCVDIKNARTLTMLEGNAQLKYEDGKAYVTVPAGEFFFGKF